MDLFDYIKGYDITKEKTFMPLVEKVIASWWNSDILTELSGVRTKKLELHTGGYSDNEELIIALRQNTLFWSLCFRKEEAGGHYYFTIKELKQERTKLLNGN